MKGYRLGNNMIIGPRPVCEGTELFCYFGGFTVNFLLEELLHVHFLFTTYVFRIAQEYLMSMNVTLKLNKTL